MSKKSAKVAGPITRRQQVAAVRQIKGAEIAAAVATNIREAVKQEVETQFKSIKDTMLDLIARAVDLESVTYEGDSHDQSERDETLMRTQEDDVVRVHYVCSKCGWAGSDPREHKNCRYHAIEVPLGKMRNDCDSDDRSERAEALEVQQDDQVVPDERLEGEDCSSQHEEEGPTSR